MSVALIAAACSGASDPQTVTMRAALTFPVGSNITSVTYAVLSSSGVFLQGGTVAVSDPNATVWLNLMLDPATGEVVQLAATTNAGASCTGQSSPFDVVAGGATFIDVTLVCGGGEASSTSCPEVHSLTVAPEQAVFPDGTISAGVSVTETDATQQLSYSWTATAGTFSDASAASTTYTCGTVGPQTLTLTVTEGTPPWTCAATSTFLVECIAGADAGAPAL